MTRSIRGHCFIPPLVCALCAALLLVSCGHGQKEGNPNGGPPSTNLTAGERAYLKAHGPLIYAPDPAFPPFESFDENGSAVGIAPDLLEMAARNIGAEVKTVRYQAWSGVIAAAKEGKIDVLTTVLRTPEREKYLLFTRPFMSSPYVLFVNDSRAGISSISDLRAKRVAVEANSGSHDWLADHHPEIEIVAVPNAHDGLVMVSMGQADALLENLAVGATVARENGLANIKILPTPLYESAEHFAVPRDRAQLLPILQKGLDAIPKETLSALFLKWTGRDLSLKHPPLAAWERNLLIVFLAIILTGAAWVFTLRRAVKASTKALRESEARFRRFFEGDVAANYVSIPQGRILDCNEAFVKLFGFKDKKAALAALPEEFYLQKGGREKFLERLKQKKILTMEEETYRSSDGRELRCLENTIGIFDSSGRLVEIMGYIFDVTAHRRAEEKFRTVFQSSPMAMSLSRIEDGRFIELNESFTRLFECSREQVIGHTASELGFWVNPDDRRKMVQTVKRDGRARNLEPEGMSLKGRHFQGRYHAERIILDDEPCILSIIEDITEEKRAEALLREKEMELQQSKKMEAIGQLAGGIAHDFNNILAGILGNAEILAEKLEEQPSLKTYAEQVQGAAERAGRLIRQLLSFARKGRYQIASVDLNKTINDAVAILEGTIDKRIRISLRLGAKRSGVKGDQAVLESAILNLAINARDAMPEGGELRIETKDVAESGEDAPPLVQVIVSDTGLGMTAEEQQHLFEPFYTTKGPERGTGLGLASVYGAVQSHGGSISVESGAGKGTTFVMTLPVTEEEPSVSAGDSSAPAPAFPARVILVDDEPAILEVVREVLEGRGHEVRAFSSGESAVEYFSAAPEKVDLVLLDMIMPQMSGLEVFRAMKSVCPGVKALLISGYSVEKQASDLMAEGVKGCLNKPFKRAELIAKVEAILAEK